MRTSARPARPSRARIGLALAAASLLALAAGIVAAEPASAAKVVDVRVGRHPDFTRIVFELDARAGYRVVRQSPAPGKEDVLVYLDASSGGEQTLRLARSPLERLDVKPHNGGTAARIRLSGKDLTVKEMILSGPPRIVLDVMNPEAPRTAKKPAPKPKVAKAAPPKPAPKPVAKPPAPAKLPAPEAKAPAPARAAAPPAARPTPEPAPAPAPEVAKPAPEPAPKPTAKEEPAPSKPTTVAKAEPPAAALAPGARPGAPPPGEAPPAAAAKPPPSGPTPAAPSPAPPGAKPGGPMPGAQPGPPGAKTAPAAPPAARPPGPPQRPAPPASPARPAPGEARPGLFRIAMIAAAGAGVALIVIFVLLRRRSAARSEEITEAFEAGPEAEGEDPFASLRSTPDRASEATAVIEPGEEEPGLFDQPSTPAAAPGREEKKEADMDMHTDASEGATVAGMRGTMGGATEDVMQLVRELERRMAHLESRLDEEVDARERLERQVAAQTEELRVQRAAIARTQRALRNMTRPEDDAATEPAPREQA